MNSSNYITPFWVQNTSESSWTLYLYARNSGSSHGDLDWTIDVEYSTNLLTWSDFGTTPTTINNSISRSFSANQRVYLRSKTQCTHWGKYDVSNSRYWYIQIFSNQQHSVGGNIMSLIYGSTFATNRNYTTFPDDTLIGIFQGLFHSNTYLVDAGELVLPVTHSTSTLPPEGVTNTSPLNRVYRSMFQNCSRLVNGPHIDLRDRGITDLAYCFQLMFSGCTSLMSLHINTVDANYRYNSMFNSSGGADGGICYDYSGGPTSGAFPSQRWTRQNVVSTYLPTYDRVVDWHSNYSGYVNQVNDNQNRFIYKKTDDKHTPFYVTNLTSSSVNINVKKISTEYHSGSYDGADSAPTITIEYSKDGTTWNTWCTTSSSQVHTMLIPPYTTYYFRSSTSRWAIHFYWGSSHIETVAYNNISFSSFSGTPTVELGGNIMSLLYGSNFTGNETSFPDNQYTYTFAYLFNRDSHAGGSDDAITHTRNLIMPATTLTESAYRFMFYGNTSLISTPNLPATTLAPNCYDCMFRGCTSLTCVSALPATTLAQECYWAMFAECTSLEIAPELKALTIPYNTGGVGPSYVGAYSGMFSGCTSLKYVKCLATSPTDGKGTTGWFNNVTQTGTFVKKAGTTWVSGTAGIPSDWTVVEV